MKAMVVAALLISIVGFMADRAGAEPIKISDTEALTIVKTIQGYMETKKNSLDIFDRKKGKVVTLTLDRIVTDDPACVMFPNEGKVAVCGECTEVAPHGKASGQVQSEQTGAKYVIWFLLERGNMVNSRVLDTFIKSVDGQEMYTWEKNAEGQWEATLVPDKPAEAAPAAPKAAE
jgi:hypothetical protein